MKLYGLCADPSLSVRLVLTASQLRTLCQAFPDPAQSPSPRRFTPSLPCTSDAAGFLMWTAVDGGHDPRQSGEDLVVCDRRTTWCTDAVAIADVKSTPIELRVARQANHWRIALGGAGSQELLFSVTAPEP